MIHPTIAAMLMKQKMNEVQRAVNNAWMFRELKKEPSKAWFKFASVRKRSTDN